MVIPFGFLSRSDAVWHSLYNCSKTVGGLRAGLQMKVILPGSLKGSGCDWVETLRGLTFDVPQVGVSPTHRQHDESSNHPGGKAVIRAPGCNCSSFGTLKSVSC